MRWYEKAFCAALTAGAIYHIATHNFFTASEQAQKNMLLKPVANSYANNILKQAEAGNLKVYCFEMPGGRTGKKPGGEKGKGLTFSEIFSEERADGRAGNMPSPAEMRAVMSAINRNEMLAPGVLYCGFDENNSGDLDAITKRGIRQQKTDYFAACSRVQGTRK